MLMKSAIKKMVRSISNPFSSSTYWERRYESGGNSGSGSYNELGAFKAGFINNFLKTHDVNSAIELGCGDGNQLSSIHYPAYTGLDVSIASLAICSRRFNSDPTKSFFLYSPHSFHDNRGIFKADLSLSLDVLFHLVEPDIFELHLKHLFQCSTRYVIIYSSDEEIKSTVRHEKRRKFTPWVEHHQPEWHLVERKNNPYVGEEHEDKKSFSDFFLYEKRIDKAGKIL
jgi:hypothetical protein